MKYHLYFYPPNRFYRSPAPDLVTFRSFERLKSILFKYLGSFVLSRQHFAEFARIKTINLEFNKLYQTSLGDFLIIEE